MKDGKHTVCEKCGFEIPKSILDADCDYHKAYGTKPHNLGIHIGSK